MNEKIKVLMVDDEAQFRSTTKKILTRRGFETILAESGEEAIKKLKENPDVVILDVKMPGMDGHQTLNEIKKRHPDLPVIMLTGHGSMPSAQEALISGAFDYLSKPCDIDLLANKINDAREQKKKEDVREEKKVKDLMVPIDYFTTLNEEQTIKEAVQKLQESLNTTTSTSRIMETRHRSVLVFDVKGKVKGILNIRDLLEGMMPAYLSAPKPSMADSIQYSPMFWRGMFTREVKQLASRRIKEIMSPAPLTIDGEANLMEAAYVIFTNKIIRLVVMRGDEVIGVIREQDLFFEMERILKN